MNNRFYLIAYLLLATAPTAAATFPLDPKNMLHHADQVQDEIKKQSAQAEAYFTNRRESLKQKRRLLAEQRDTGRISQRVYEQELENIRADEKRLDDDEVAARKRGNDIDSTLLNGANLYMQYTTQAAIEQEKRATAVAQAEIAQEGAMERLKVLLQPENIKQIALFGGLGIAGIVATHHVSRVTVEYVKEQWVKPALVDETSRISWKEYAQQWWYGKPQEPKVEDVILPPVVQQKIRSTAALLQTCRQYRMPLGNLLLYGEPGTGKTMFARSLALESGMDYAVIKGPMFASFFANNTHLEALKELFRWAKASPRGLIIFIDEADAVCKSLTLPGNPQMQEVLQALKAETGAPSKEFMFIFATNYPELLDDAIVSRVTDEIYFPLPGLAERTALFKRYLTQQLRAYEFPLALEPGIDEAWYQALAATSDGITGRKIEQIANECAKMALHTNKGIITKTLVQNALHEIVAQQQQAKQWRQNHKRP